MAIHAHANRGRNGHDDSELFWLAFRYCMGEMSPDEALDFEERLDFDQEAREAVAEAVELGAATELAETQLPEPYFILPWFLRPASLLAALERADGEGWRDGADRGRLRGAGDRRILAARARDPGDAQSFRSTVGERLGDVGRVRP